MANADPQKRALPVELEPGVWLARLRALERSSLRTL